MSDYIKRKDVLKLIESTQAWGWSMNRLYDEMQALPAEGCCTGGTWEMDTVFRNG